MKKIFKALSVLAVGATLCAGVAAAAGCSAGKSGEYYGDYHYTSEHDQVYGMKVKVTVKNNIITKVEDVTNGAYTTVSTPWEEYCEFAEGGAISYYYWAYGKDVDMSLSDEEKIAYVKANPISWYGWTNSSVDNWTSHVAWLAQQYEGLSVAEVLDIKVFTKYGYEKQGENMVANSAISGEPYGAKEGWNAELLSSGLLISGSTQGSGRLLLAVQDALSK